jgi:hypothetical protein
MMEAPVNDGKRTMMWAGIKQDGEREGGEWEKTV